MTCTLFALQVSAQEDGAMNEALRRAWEKGKLMTAISGAGYHEGLVLAGGRIGVDSTLFLRIPIEAGREYYIIGSLETENAILDLTLFLDGTELEADRRDDATPIITFQSDSALQAVLQVHLRAANQPYHATTVCILANGGAPLPLGLPEVWPANFLPGHDAKDSRWYTFAFHPGDEAVVELSGLPVGRSGCTARVLAGSSNADLSLDALDADSNIVRARSGWTDTPTVRVVPEGSTALTFRIGQRATSPPPLLFLGVISL